MVDPQEFKARWVAALRSGDYQQGRLAWMNIDADGQKDYCCLGVACDLLDIELIPFDSNYPEDIHILFEVMPALQVRQPGQLGTFDQSDAFKQLVTMNDSQRLSFIEIADWIEQNL